MRISDWSSDVCSSDLVYYDTVEIIVNGGDARSATLHWQGCADAGICYPPQTMRVDLPSVETPPATKAAVDTAAPTPPSEKATSASAPQPPKHGRAACRERVCQRV